MSSDIYLPEALMTDTELAACLSARQTRVQSQLQFLIDWHPESKFYVEYTPVEKITRSTCFFCSGYLDPFNTDGIGAFNVLEPRITVRPSPSTPDDPSSECYFQLPCFMQCADLFDSDFLDRLLPLNRINYANRGMYLPHGVPTMSFLPVGMEMLIFEWRDRRRQRLKESYGLHRHILNRTLDYMLHFAGSADYQVPEYCEGLSDEEVQLLSTTMAPIEMDPQSGVEWNLFDFYLEEIGRDQDFLEMVFGYLFDTRIATVDDDQLDADEQKRKVAMGANAVNALKRLSNVVLPA